MAPRRLLIHVGYHKTATTWMQAQLFRPPHGYAPLMRHRDVFRLITAPHGLDFDPGPARAEIARRMAETPDHLAPVISSEILSGNPFFGGRESDAFAERLARIAPDARILVSIRAQLKILPSVYMQYLLRGGTLPYRRFFTEETRLGYGWFSPRHFEYDRLVAHYQALFGADDVHVLQQEALAADMDAACAALAAFAGADAYAGLAEDARAVRSPSYPEHAVWALRRVNHVQSSVLNRAPVVALGRNPDGLYRATGYVLRTPLAARLMGHRRPVSDWVARHFAGHYDASNARLAAIARPAPDLSAYR